MCFATMRSSILIITLAVIPLFAFVSNGAVLDALDMLDAVARAKSTKSSITDIGTEPYLRVASSSGGQCPENITHGTATSVGNVPGFEGFGIEGRMPFSEISVNDVKCNSDKDGDELLLLSQDELDRLRPLLNDSFLRLSKERAKKIFLAGFDREARICGSFRGAKETFYGWTKDVGVLNDVLSNLGVAVPKDKVVSGERWMFSYVPSTASVCAFIDSSAPSLNEKEPEPSAEPTTNPDSQTPPGSDTNPPPSGGGLGTTPQPTTTDSEVCFPASATVELEGGIVKRMDQVQLGDRVKVADGVYSDVFMFTHKMAHVSTHFVTLQLSNGAQLALTPGHYLYVNGRLVAAKTVRAGDLLQNTAETAITVEAVQMTRMSGLYNPQTVHGDIIVNGVRASTYTTAVEPSTAHALLAPLRVLYSRLGLATTLLDSGSDFLAAQVPSGPVVVS